jgi:hypothetical protein
MTGKPAQTADQKMKAQAQMRAKRTAANDLFNEKVELTLPPIMRPLINEDLKKLDSNGRRKGSVTAENLKLRTA